MNKIETDRLVLKKLSTADTEQLVSLLGNLKVSRTLSNVPYPYTRNDADKWLSIVGSQKFNLNTFLNKHLIGGVGLTLDEGDGLYELGYWLGVDYWGRGYATESVKGLLDHAKLTLQSQTLKANIHAKNVASANVLTKIGFKRVGEGKVFSLSRQKNISSVHYEYQWRD